MRGLVVLVACAAVLSVTHAANLRRQDLSGNASTVSTETLQAIEGVASAAATRDAASEAQEATTRSDRQNKFGVLDKLLQKLRRFIEAEQKRVGGEYDADVERIKDVRDDQIAQAAAFKNETIETLRGMVHEKTRARDETSAQLEAKTSVHDVKVSAHEEEQASLAKAVELQASSDIQAAKLHGEQQAACATNRDRLTAAATTQRGKDIGFLNDALAFIASLRQQFSLLQSANHGTGATMLLSIQQVTQLRGLVSGYARKTDQNYLNASRIALRQGMADDILKAMETVEIRVREEKAAVDSAHGKNLDGITVGFDSCMGQAEDGLEAARTNAASFVAKFTANEAASRDARLVAKAELDAATAQSNAAEESLKAALNEQTAGVAEAKKEYLAAQASAEQLFALDARTYSKKKVKAQVYLSGELDLINQIEVALTAGQHVGTQQAMMLTELSQRLAVHTKRRLQVRYVDTLGGDSLSIRDDISKLLDSIGKSLATEMEKSTAEKASNDQAVHDFYAQAEEEASRTLAGKLAELQAAVDSATEKRRIASEERDVAASMEATALAAKDQASAQHTAALTLQKDQSAIAQQTRTAEEGEQDEIKATSLELAGSKKRQSRKYLTQERATVSSIEEMLEDLGRNYAFKPAAKPTQGEATGFLSVSEVEGQRKMTMEQKEGLSMLLSLLGSKGAAHFTGAERTFEGGNRTEARTVISQVLDQVREAIAASENQVEANFDKDTAQVENEFKTARAASKRKFDAEIARLQKEVDDAKAQLEKSTDHHEEMASILKSKQVAFTQRDADLKSAVSVQIIEKNVAEKRYAADQAAAAQYRDQRLVAVAAEHDGDVRHITEEQQMIAEIRKAFSEINFASFLEAGVKYDEDQKSYMATNSVGVKAKVLTLLTSIEDSINREFERAAIEFSMDNESNKAEFERANAQAISFRAADVEDLQRAVDSAREDFKASDEELDAANKEHSLAADRHQEDRDDLATAKAIEKTNAPVFEAEFQRSKKHAEAIYGEEMEILTNQKTRGDFYLSTGTHALQSVRGMLSHLDMTTTHTDSKPASDPYAGRQDYETQLSDARFVARTSEELARVDTYHQGAVKSFNVESTNGDTIIKARGWDGAVSREHVAQSANSVGYSRRRQYDDRGVLLGTFDTIAATNYLDNHPGAKAATPNATAMLELRSGGLHRRRNKEQGGGGGDDTVGTFIGGLVNTKAKELDRSQKEFDEAVGGVSETRDKVLAKARQERNTLLKRDDERTKKAQDAFDKSLEILTSAQARKTAAAARHDTAAAALNDALRTQEGNGPSVEAELKEALEFNKRTFDAATKDVKAKKEEADIYLSDELALIHKVRSLVNEKLGAAYPRLVEVVSHLVARRAKNMGLQLDDVARNQYTFTKRESDRFVDTQGKHGQDYMVGGTVEANDYGGHVTNIDDLLQQNLQRIQKELADVTGRHGSDMEFLQTERRTALSAALDKYNARVAALQSLVDAAQKAFDEAFEARSKQEEIRNEARGDYDRKQGSLDAAKLLQASNMTLETTIRTNADVATLEEFDRAMASFATEETRARAIIEREQDILAEIRGVLSGHVGLARAATASTPVDDCAATQSTYDVKVKNAVALGDACAEAAVLEAGSKPFDKAACPAAKAAKAAVDEAKAAYDACLAQPAAGQLVAASLIELNRMAQKYIEAETYNKATADDIAAALQILDRLDKALVDEDNTVSALAGKDREAETTLRDEKYEAALARWTRAKGYHDGIVQAQADIRDAAKSKWRKHFAKWGALLDAQQKRSAELVEKKAHMVSEEAIADSIHAQEDLAAQTRYATQKIKVDSIKENDGAYLNAEISAIEELAGLLEELNLKGRR